MKKTKMRMTRNRKTKKHKNKTKTKKMVGGNNPFSDIFGMWGTMTYNLSNAISVFSITPPAGATNPTSKVIDPSPGKQFL
jgi:hypothetical protein